MPGKYYAVMPDNHNPPRYRVVHGPSTIPAAICYIEETANRIARLLNADEQGKAERQGSSFMGIRVVVDETIPPGEWRLVADQPDPPPLPEDIDYEGQLPAAINALLDEARRLRRERGERGET